MWQRDRGRRRLFTAVAVLVAVAASGQSASAAPAAEGEPPAYRTAEGAESVRGADNSADADELKPGLYTDSIGPGEERYYSVTLDAESSAFLSAVAVPEPGGKVSYGDGIEVVLQDTDGQTCERGSRSFGSVSQPHPIATYASRTIEKNGRCQEAGPYNVILKRQTAATSDPGRWRVEIRYMSEPGVTGGSLRAPSKGGWSTEPPPPPAEKARKSSGGTGFNDAPALDSGVWRDELLPGQTRFYRLPVDWGQQFTVRAELANARMSEDHGFAASGLGVEVYNPARGFVASQTRSYDGKQAAARVGPGAPVAYDNRYDYGREVSALRFAGWYYVAVSLRPEVAEFAEGSVPLTLRLNIDGEPGSGPKYAGDAAAAGFGNDSEPVEEGDRKTAAGESGRDRTMKLVAAAGLGTGTVLVIGLGVWALLARRRGAAGRQPDRSPEQLPGGFPEQRAEHRPAPAADGWQAPRQPGDGAGYGPPPAW
ncbi:hypothetical protein [Streptomyces sp. TP-A0874]|uniref:hypothetical protein n=1 Tax=Streptomyces sp. TP-A0874 TaxID=549819 RepID=UPI000853B5D4|nr:hypothetical protein [Streptomyces sp. TP-A0874]